MPERGFLHLLGDADDLRGSAPGQVTAISHLAHCLLSFPLLSVLKGTKEGQVSARSLPVSPEVSGATSLAYAGGEGIQQRALHTGVLGNTPSPLTRAPAGSDPGAARSAPKGSMSVAGAAMTSSSIIKTTEGPGARRQVKAKPPNPKGSVSVAGAAMISISITKAAEGPGARRFLLAWKSKGNTSAQDGGQQTSQLQAEALRGERDKENWYLEALP